MKKTLAAVCLLALGLCAGVMLSHSGAIAAKAAPLPAVAAAPAAPAVTATEPATVQDRDHDRDDRRAGREQHPHIRGAIRELNEAKRELQTAAHDFGGHRVDAIKACDEAIRQLQEALQYDKK